jgi:hypothetical protein
MLHRDHQRDVSRTENQAGDDPEEDWIHTARISLFLLRFLSGTERLAAARRQTAARRHTETVAAATAAELVTRLLVTAFAFFAHDKSTVRFPCNFTDQLM